MDDGWEWRKEVLPCGRELNVGDFAPVVGELVRDDELGAYLDVVGCSVVVVV